MNGTAETDARVNLKFFRAVILDQSLRKRPSSSEEITPSIMSDFAAVEAVHWTGVGVRIGYLDRKAAYDLISPSKIFRSWLDLQERGSVSTNDPWHWFLRFEGSGGKLVLDEERYSDLSKIDPETREGVHNWFQTFFLLASENLLDENSHYFLDSIGWTDDQIWKWRKEGAGFERGVNRIWLGFANVLNYADQMNQLVQMLNTGKAPEGAANLWDYARAIIAPRFNLVRRDKDLNLPITERYFSLAGEFAGQARENNPAWLDARTTVFASLFAFVNFLRGIRPDIRENEAHLWNVFTRGIETSFSGSLKPQETPENE
jgi:hypothetical protein